MQQDVVEYRTQRVVGVLARGRLFDGLGDGDAQRPGGIRVLREDLAPGLGLVGGAGQHFRPPGLHHGAPEGLLLVADLHHVDAHVDTEHPAGERKGRTPLAGPGLGGQAADAGLAVVIGLGHGRVGLVRAGRTGPFVLVIDLRRGLQRGLQAVGPEQGRRPPEPVDLAHRLRDRDPALGRDLLLDEGHREDGGERLGADGLAIRSQRWGGGMGHVGDDVVPGGGDLGLVEQDLGLGHVVFLLIRNRPHGRPSQGPWQMRPGAIDFSPAHR